jgi:hypothetical protein
LLAGLLAGHGLGPLDPHRACRDACTTTSPALGARRAATQEAAVDIDSNASFAGEVERNVSRDNDFLLCGQLFKTPQLVVGQYAVSSQRKQGSATPCRYWHWGNCAPKSP